MALCYDQEDRFRVSDMDLWQHAKETMDDRDEVLARSLGFDRCQQCGEWFHQDMEGWVDCLRCGRHCPACAELVEWEWCDICGLNYCQDCYGDDATFVCDVCLTGTWDD